MSCCLLELLVLVLLWRNEIDHVVFHVVIIIPARINNLDHVLLLLLLALHLNYILLNWLHLRLLLVNNLVDNLDGLLLDDLSLNWSMNDLLGDSRGGGLDWLLNSCCFFLDEVLELLLPILL